MEPSETPDAPHIIEEVSPSPPTHQEIADKIRKLTRELNRQISNAVNAGLVVDVDAVSHHSVCSGKYYKVNVDIFVKI